MAGANHSGVIKGIQSVSFERSRAGFLIMPQTCPPPPQAVHSTGNRGRMGGPMFRRKHSVDTCQGFWVELVWSGPLGEGRRGRKLH